MVVAEEQWDETQHELQRRIGAIVEQGRLTDDHAKRLHHDVLALVDERVIEVIPRRLYEHMEVVARRRVPRDPRDWPPVALALVLEAGILTGDHDFLGCGCPTWTAEMLRGEPGRS